MSSHRQSHQHPRVAKPPKPTRETTQVRCHGGEKADHNGTGDAFQVTKSSIDNQQLMQIGYEVSSRSPTMRIKTEGRKVNKRSDTVPGGRSGCEWGREPPIEASTSKTGEETPHQICDYSVRGSDEGGKELPGRDQFGSGCSDGAASAQAPPLRNGRVGLLS